MEVLETTMNDKNQITGLLNATLDDVILSVTAVAQDAVNAIETSSEVPIDAKSAIKKFIGKTLNL